MPGLSLVCGKGLENILFTINSADLERDTRYKVEKLIDNANCMCIISAYREYPWQVYENDEAIIVVEGLIYNRSESEIEKSLLAISKTYMENGNHRASIKKFIDAHDGDFNILIHNKVSQKLLIFNDRWGRLPAYLYYEQGLFMFSRELKLILDFLPSIEFDNISLSEFLLFEFILGERTLISGVSRVMPSCLIEVCQYSHKMNITTDRIFDLNFEDAEEILSRDECIENCKGLLLQSTNERIRKIKERGYNISADLSGGFDTRAVFGALNKNPINVDYHTAELVTGDESEYAIEAAALYGKEVTKVVASHSIDINEMSKVIYQTDCTVNGFTALSCYQDAVARLAHVKEPSVRITGLGGGAFIKRIPKAKRGYQNIASMMKAGHLTGLGNMEKVCNIMKLDEKTFLNHLQLYLGEYPESTLKGKLRHWHFEYENKLVSFGEDRERASIWTVDPLWSKDFLSFVTLCIPEKYVDEYYYFQFLEAIDPILLSVPIYSSGIVTASKLKSLYKNPSRNLYDFLLFIGRFNKLVRWILKAREQYIMNRHDNQRNVITSYILDNWDKANVLASFSDENRIHDFVKFAPVGYLYRLLTVILYFKKLEGKYGDRIKMRAN